MMKSKIIFILSIYILASGCQKRKYPEDQVKLNKEEVYVDGYVDGEPVNLKIGADGYYCYSSYKQNADSIYLFKGELRKYDCNPCPRSLQVELSDYQARLIGSSVDPELAFQKGTRNFIPALPITSTIRFVSHSNKTISSQTWSLSNGLSSKDSVIDVEFGQPGPQTVSLTIKTTGNSESMVVNKIFVSDEAGLFACSISAGLVQNNLSQFSGSVVGGTPPFHYTWSFGDGATSTQSLTNHDYQWPGSYPVRLVVKDAKNHVCESNYIHVAGNDISSCTANMSLSFAGSRNALLKGVRLQWTDRSNVIFRSDSVSQPVNSYFEIINSQPYVANEQGESGRLLTLRFNVLVSDGRHKMWFKTENMTIVVAYK